MAGTDYKKMSKEEITAGIKTNRETLFQLRNQATTEKVEDISQFKKVRREIARLMTERSSRNSVRAAIKAKAVAKREAAAAKPAPKFQTKTTSRIRTSRSAAKAGKN